MKAEDARAYVLTVREDLIKMGFSLSDAKRVCGYVLAMAGHTGGGLK